MSLNEVLKYAEFLPKDTLQEFLALSLSKQDAYTESGAITNSLHYPDWRKSLVLFPHSFPELAQTLEARVRSLMPEVCYSLGIPVFSPSKIEQQLSAHWRGDFYRRHSDNASPSTASRMLTFCWYFHQEPKAFEGGELWFVDTGEVVVPSNNLAIFFDSSRLHEVSPTIAPDFKQSRFAISGWIRR